MKRNYNEKYQETYYEEILDNGLKVIIWHKPGFETSQFLFATPYGALDYVQEKEDGTILEFPSGIAHFLEHKMFENEGIDVMERFSQLGANVNAFTSYNETVYYFSTTKQEVEEEVNLLLDFVQELSITEESVEKEKGIIVQELNMYLQMADSRLLFESFKSLYHHHPLNQDIGGNETSVTSTKLEQLKACHTLNYHPSKMIFVAVTAIEPDAILQIVKENQARKHFSETFEVKRMFEKEPAEVARKEFCLPMEVARNKTALSYKLPVDSSSSKQRLKKEWAVRFLLESHFSNLNPDYQMWLDEQTINDFFGYEVDFGKDYSYLLFYGEADKQQFVPFIKEQLKKLSSKPMAKEVLEQIKRRYYGMYVRIFNSQENIALNYIRNAFADMNMYDVLDIIHGITIDDIQMVWQSLDWSHDCITEIVPNA